MDPFLVESNPHSVIFLGEMQTKFYCKNIGTIVIFDKKIFKFLCHMIGSNHYWGKLGRGVGDSLCKKSKGLPHPLAQIASVVVWPYHVTPLFHASFSQRFRFCHCFFSKILQSICSHNSDAVHRVWLIVSGVWPHNSWSTPWIYSTFHSVGLNGEPEIIKLVCCEAVCIHPTRL